MNTVKVLSNYVLPNTTTRVLEIEPVEGIEIRPGSGLTLSLNDIERSFSFASAYKFIFYIREVEDGEFNRELVKVQTGDEIEVVDYFYYFVINLKAPSYYFATGTGIAPFITALECNGVRPRKLFYGAKKLGDLIGLKWLNQVTDVVPVLSQEQRGNFGHITDYITKDIVDSEANYYICGLDRMVNDVSSKLIDMGVNQNQISIELFYMKN